MDVTWALTVAMREMKARRKQDGHGALTKEKNMSEKQWLATLYVALPGTLKPLFSW